VLEVKVTARTSPRVLVLVATAALGVPLVTTSPGAVAASRPAATIHPAGEVNFGGVSCEIGAVMRQGHTVYLAIPASCGGIDAGKVQDGCAEPITPAGLPVSIEGAKHRGHLVYNSFTAMQSRGDVSPNRCYYNDLALVKVNRHDRHRVTATIPGTGAPRSVLATLPKSGTSLKFGANTATAGATQHQGWVLLANTMAMLKTANVGAPVTIGNKLVGMLLVLPKGPIPMVPLLQQPGQIFNLARAIKQLHKLPRFRHVRLVHAGERI
jgi:hypothetical protein